MMMEPTLVIAATCLVGICVVAFALLRAELPPQLLEKARKRVVEFLIATENELQKVSWPPGHEVVSSSVVVVVTVIVVGERTIGGPPTVDARQSKPRLPPLALVSERTW